MRSIKNVSDREIFIYWRLNKEDVSKRTLSALFRMLIHFEKNNKAIWFEVTDEKYYFFALDDQIAIEMAEWALARIPEAQYQLNPIYGFTY